MVGKFHYSQRHWPGGMPDSIKETTYKEPAQYCNDGCDHLAGEEHNWKPTLNLVDVYCPNTGCKWHVKVDEKVREYNLNGHLLSCAPHLIDTGESQGTVPKAKGVSGESPVRPPEAPGLKDSPGSKGYPSREKEDLRTAPVTPSLPSEISPDDQLYLMVESDRPLDKIIAARDRVFDHPWSWDENWSPRHPNSALFHQYKDDLGELHDRKQGDYGKGDDPFANVRASEEWGIEGWVGAMVRLNDKVRRLQSLATKGSLNNEAAIDSFMDIAVYSLIARILYEQELEK